MIIDTVFTDGECFGLLDLTAVGSAKYWAPGAPSHISIACFSIDEWPVEDWCPVAPLRGTTTDRFRQVLLSARRVVAFGDFERLWIKHQLGIDVGDKYDDLMARALYAGFPAKLEHLLAAIRAPFSKDVKGNALSKTMAKPRKLDPLTWWHEDDKVDENGETKLDRVIRYCRSDVPPLIWLDKQLPKLPEAEYRSYWYDRQANDRGVPVDVKATEEAIKVLEVCKYELEDKFTELIGHEVPTPKSSVKLREWFCRQGVPISDVQAETLNALDESQVPPLVAEILFLRKGAARSSTSKLTKFLDMADADGRIRGTIRWHGAHTGRKSNLGVQFQNMPKLRKWVQVVFDVLLEDIYDIDEKIRVLSLFGMANDLVATSLRGFLKAEEGKVFVGCDLAQIEARATAWLAGEDDILRPEVITKIYEMMASRMFGVDPAETKTTYMGGVTLRFLGKTCVLACGFGGGVAAFEKMAGQYGVKGLDVDTMEAAVKAFRKARPGTCKLWRMIEDKAINAVRFPGSMHTLAARPYVNINFFMQNHFLCIQLPGGRILRYPFAQVETDHFRGKPRFVLSYEGWRSQIKKWVRIRTWGGTLLENIIQGLSGDIMMLGTERLESNSLPAILTVHDECIVETTPDRVEEVAPHFLLQTPPGKPQWLVDLPVDGETWTAARYLKA